MKHGNKRFTDTCNAKALHATYKYLNTIHPNSIKIQAFADTIGVSRESVVNYLRQEKITPMFGYFFVEMLKRHETTNKVLTGLNLYNELSGTHFKSWEELQKEILDISKL